jgi:hypothetical protein
VNCRPASGVFPAMTGSSRTCAGCAGAAAVADAAIKTGSMKKAGAPQVIAHGQRRGERRVGDLGLRERLSAVSQRKRFVALGSPRLSCTRATARFRGVKPIGTLWKR